MSSKERLSLAFTYYLPGENGEKIEYGTNSNSVIIIGANGAGKSKLGAWIEQQDFGNVHRIGAQRNLNFKENVPLKSYSQAEDIVLFGTDEKAHQQSKGYRWGFGKEYTTKLIDDFDDVLAALIAKTNLSRDKFFEECRIAESAGKEKPHTPFTDLDKLQEIWNEIFPQRQLEYADTKFSAILQKNDTSVKYPSPQMSDGERAVLYLTSQVLCVPSGKKLIVDEPEVHLHRSIMNRLWRTLEKYRPDCLFIYITHDTQFASSHSNADKFWVKEYDGQNWLIEKIDKTDLPEELLLDILGSRRNVLFVEGEKNSYDTQLYSILYPNYYVIACGGCSQVIARTKAFKDSPVLHHCSVYEIIDRDYRSDYEIEKYKASSIFTIDVAEVENLFLVEELIRLMAVHMGKDPDVVFLEVKKFVIQQRFAGQIQKQVCQSVIAHLKYQLSSAELSKKSEEDAKNSLDNVIASLDYDKTKAEQESKFRGALDSDEYKRVLKVFNEKAIVTSIGHYLGIENKQYCNTVLALLCGGKQEEIIAALLPYLPDEIPR